MRVDATTVRDFNRIRVEPITGAIGAEVSNVDLREIDDEIIAEILLESDALKKGDPLDEVPF